MNEIEILKKFFFTLDLILLIQRLYFFISSAGEASHVSCLFIVVDLRFLSSMNINYPRLVVYGERRSLKRDS